MKMSKLITNARVYSLELPPIRDLELRLPEHASREPGDHEPETSGFCLNPYTGQWVTELTDDHSSISFSFEVHTRMLPAHVVKRELAAAVEKREQEEGRRVGRKERAEMKEAIHFALLPKAFIKTTRVECFYSYTTRTMIVPAAGRRMADLVTSALIHACGSVKAETIYIDALTSGLTARLRNALEEGDRFSDAFALGSFLHLRRTGEKATYDLSDLPSAKTGILEALEEGFSVNRLELICPEAGVHFRLADDFTLRSIWLEDDADDDAERDNEDEKWRHEAHVQSYLVGTVIECLKRDFGYRPPKDNGDPDDDLLGEGS